ncbi:hypothetical protein GXW82_36235 [Streptacidiphilus sp. 4-A2]|nr:hypothetical protein [Streptacidiphilus sp. 4-A2]
MLLLGGGSAGTAEERVLISGRLDSPPPALSGPVTVEVPTGAMPGLSGTTAAPLDSGSAEEAASGSTRSVFTGCAVLLTALFRPVNAVGTSSGCSVAVGLFAGAPSSAAQAGACEDSVPRRSSAPAAQPEVSARNMNGSLEWRPDVPLPPET